jgi:PEP-CTERM motif
MKARLFLVLVGVLVFTRDAYAISWTAGKPMMAGTDTFILTETNGTTITVGFISTGTEDAKEKAQKIKAAIDELNRPELKDKIGINGDTLTFPAVVKGFEKAKDGDKTKERDKTSSLIPESTTIDYHGVPSGIGLDGQESVFQASFGFAVSSTEILVDSNLTFSRLSSPTVNGLLTDTFNAFLSSLPAMFSSNLHLDFGNEQITFVFPPDATDGFVTNFTSDLTTQASSGLFEVPEPSTVLLFGFGLICAWSYRRCRTR